MAIVDLVVIAFVVALGGCKTMQQLFVVVAVT